MAAMAIVSRRVTVTTSPTKLNTVDADNLSGTGGVARNRGAVSVFVGGATVTAAAGYEVEAGDVVGFDLDQGESIYAVAASGTCLMHVMEGGT